MCIRDSHRPDRRDERLAAALGLANASRAVVDEVAARTGRTARVNASLEAAVRCYQRGAHAAAPLGALHAGGCPCNGAICTLVERFDTEPLADSSAKWANFIGLVLFCIDAKFCK